MRFTNLLSDEAVTKEMGRRIAAARLDRQMTQAQLAEAAGISKRTVERLEDGASPQFDNLIRCLRVLGRLEALEHLVPATPVSPIELLKRRGASRSRVRRQKETPQPAEWSWGDEA